MDVHEAIRRSRVSRAEALLPSGGIAHASSAGVTLGVVTPAPWEVEAVKDNVDSYPWTIVRARPDLRARVAALDWYPIDPRGYLTMIAEAAR